MYKLPETKHSTDPVISQGLGYVYLDSNTPNKWQSYSKPLNDSDNPVGLLFKQVQQNAKSKEVTNIKGCQFAIDWKWAGGMLGNEI